MTTVRYRFTDAPMPGGKRMVKLPLPLRRTCTRRPVRDEYDDEPELVADPEDEWELVQSFEPGHGAEYTEDGCLHVYRRRSSTHDSQPTHAQRLKVYAAKLQDLWRRKS